MAHRRVPLEAHVLEEGEAAREGPDSLLEGGVPEADFPEFLLRGRLRGVAHVREERLAGDGELVPVRPVRLLHLHERSAALLDQPDGLHHDAGLGLGLDGRGGGRRLQSLFLLLRLNLRRGELLRQAQLAPPLALVLCGEKSARQGG